MIGALEVLFWLSVFLIVYPYLIYLPIVRLMGMLRPKPVRKRAFEPAVTILIPAYNEADCIEATVSNKLGLDYPRDRLQVLVISDGSDDGTDEIVRKFSAEGVELLRREGREGKAAALNAAVKLARGDVIVFSDANSLFDNGAIREIVANFADQTVGYVTGSLSFATSDQTGATEEGGGIYLKYENALRSAETRIGSIIGVNGGVDAIRRELYTDIPKQLITDFVLPLTVIANGRRVVFEPGALAIEVPNSEISSEFRMRVRVALRALQGLSYMRRLMNPIAHPLTSFCLFSHKVVRYMGFLFMAAALIANFVLAIQSSIYVNILLLHLGCYAIAASGLCLNLPGPLGRVSRPSGYLLMSYAAFGVATFRFFRGDTMATWRPRAG